MPAATAPLGKPSEAAKPAAPGAKPAAPAASDTPQRTDDEEEEETPGLQPVHLGISVVALLIAALFLYTTYTADQTPNRTSEYLFGTPKTEDSSYSSSDYSSSDDDDDDRGGSSSSSDDEDDEDDED